MNKVIMMGRLTRDPEIRYSQGAQPIPVARFSLAVDRRFKREGQADADFFNCVAFNKTAEFCQNYLKQGTKVVVEGRLQNDNYTNKNGEKVYSVQINVESIEFAESKRVAEANAANAQYAQPVQQGQVAVPPQNVPVGDGFVNMDIVDELPF